MRRQKARHAQLERPRPIGRSRGECSLQPSCASPGSLVAAACDPLARLTGRLGITAAPEAQRNPKLRSGVLRAGDCSKGSDTLCVRTLPPKHETAAALRNRHSLSILGRSLPVAVGSVAWSGHHVQRPGEMLGGSGQLLARVQCRQSQAAVAGGHAGGSPAHLHAVRISGDRLGLPPCPAERLRQHRHGLFRALPVALSLDRGLQSGDRVARAPGLQQREAQGQQRLRVAAAPLHTPLQLCDGGRGFVPRELAHAQPVPRVRDGVGHRHRLHGAWLPPLLRQPQHRRELRGRGRDLARRAERKSQRAPQLAQLAADLGGIGLHLEH